jgi:hypothetical protein
VPTSVRSDRTARHAERLWLGAAGWTAVATFAVMLGAALLPISAGLSIGAVAVALVIGAVLAVTTAPPVTVADGELTAGEAHIPVSLLGAVTVLDRQGVRREMGPDLDARAYVCLRSWIGPAIRVEVTDPADPTPYWIVSSRHPAALSAAIEGERPAPGP